MRLHGCSGLLVAPRVFRAPEAPAAREARRPHFVRRRASKPARALRSLRRPPHQWGLVCWRVAWRIVSKPGQAPPPPTGTAARPHHRPRAPQPGPSSSSGALHTSGAWCAGVWLGASSRSPARPRAPAAEPTPNFACNSVVTLKPTAPLLTAHHFRPFRARFSLAEAMSVSFSRPHPLAKVPPVS